MLRHFRPGALYWKSISDIVKCWHAEILRVRGFEYSFPFCRNMSLVSPSAAGHTYKMSHPARFCPHRHPFYHPVCHFYQLRSLP